MWMQLEKECYIALLRRKRNQNALHIRLGGSQAESLAHIVFQVVFRVRQRAALSGIEYLREVKR
jgi:hypothetical protein